jgi:hypothetical protein
VPAEIDAVVHAERGRVQRVVAAIAVAQHTAGGIQRQQRWPACCRRGWPTRRSRANSTPKFLNCPCPGLGLPLLRRST